MLLMCLLLLVIIQSLGIFLDCRQKNYVVQKEEMNLPQLNCT